MDDVLLIYFYIVLGVVALLIIVSIFCEVEIRTDKYDGWIYRWAKHIKCGAIHGHVYHNGECLRCGKQEHQEKRHE